MKMRGLWLAVGLLVVAMPAMAQEYPIGAPQTRHGMEIGAVYLQPVTMAPAGMMRPAARSDIHLEADIHALAQNPNGFAEGDWMPYLVITYQVTRQGGDLVARGDLMPMVANDGPHYGDNVKLEGPGRYTVQFHIAPPSVNHAAHFGRHTDRLTGVQPWFKPFTVEYSMIYAGIGKKGGY